MENQGSRSSNLKIYMMVLVLLIFENFLFFIFGNLMFFMLTNLFKTIIFIDVKKME